MASAALEALGAALEAAGEGALAAAARAVAAHGAAVHVPARAVRAACRAASSGDASAAAALGLPGGPPAEGPPLGDRDDGDLLELCAADGFPFRARDGFPRSWAAERAACERREAEGHPAALNNLGVLRARGLGWLPRDEAAAGALLRRAAEAAEAAGWARAAAAARHNLAVLGAGRPAGFLNRAGWPLGRPDVASDAVRPVSKALLDALREAGGGPSASDRKRAVLSCLDDEDEWEEERDDEAAKLEDSGYAPALAYAAELLAEEGEIDFGEEASGLLRRAAEARSARAMLGVARCEAAEFTPLARGTPENNLALARLLVRSVLPLAEAGYLPAAAVLADCAGALPPRGESYEPLGEDGEPNGTPVDGAETAAWEAEWQSDLAAWKNAADGAQVDGWRRVF